MHSPMKVFILTISSVLVVVSGQLETAFRWRYVDFVWPSALAREQALATGAFNITGALPMDVDVSQDNRVFVTFANLEGVPVRLGYITSLIGPSGPLVQPYPDWTWFQSEDCNTSIQEVYRITIDECNRLWVLDTGHAFGVKGTKCPPKLLSFDLATNTLLTRVNIPDNITLHRKYNITLVATVIVETSKEQCDKTDVYIADANSNVLIYWNGARFYRLESQAFQPVEKYANVSIAGIEQSVAAGIVGMSLSPRIFPGEPRFLYFRPLASVDLYNADTKSIKRVTTNQSIEIYGSQNILTSQAIGQAFSSAGTLFLGMTKEIAIACWNRYKKLAPENIEIVAQDNTTLQYVDAVKVIPESVLGVEEVWVLSNRYQAFVQNLLDFDEYNFHILRAPAKNLVTGTKCEPPLKVAQELKKRERNSQEQWDSVQGFRYEY